MARSTIITSVCLPIKLREDIIKHLDGKRGFSRFIQTAVRNQMKQENKINAITFLDSLSDAEKLSVWEELKKATL